MPTDTETYHRGDERAGTNGNREIGGLGGWDQRWEWVLGMEREKKTKREGLSWVWGDRERMMG